jgi:ubiquinol-cytochrome c reductase cytochrome b subunit
LVGIAATVTIAPVWLYGPSASGEASAGSQPDWYTGFLDGALRLVPPGWGFVWLGHTWALAILIPLVVVTIFLLGLLLYPFVERWITGDSREHNILDRPRNTATRTAIGIAGLTFYGALWGAGSADLLATQLSLRLESVLAFYQGLVLIGPILAFSVTRRICFALQKKDQETLLHGYETGRIVRLPGGRYVEVHEDVDPGERWRLENPGDYSPILLQPDSRGHIGLTRRLRARLSGFFFEDRVRLALPPAPGVSASLAYDSLDPRGSGHGDE